MNLENNIQKFLSENSFSKIEEILNSIGIKNFSEILIKITFDNESLISYTFVCMLLTKKETAELHYLAAEILAMPLCHLEGAYLSALCHARKAICLDPKDLSLKEFLLFFYKLPEKLISDDEARDIANYILKKEPNNKIAKLIIDSF